ncbi:hypothetical protein [Cardiobacterium hominis]|uniref:hypothetical protein n=1 Tax=Cardiobacterium hominis TaxID=2718 RepID=UPI0028EFC97D|nr:hypothetical protein [Cardiobacterium hominis]
MNMMRQILQTVRLVCSFKACRRELDAIEQLPKEQTAEKEQRLSRLRAINMLEQVFLFIMFFSFALMMVYDAGNYLKQLLEESSTLGKYFYIPVFLVAAILFFCMMAGIFSYIWEKLEKLESRIEGR